MFGLRVRCSNYSANTPHTQPVNRWFDIIWVSVMLGLTVYGPSMFYYCHYYSFPNTAYFGQILANHSRGPATVDGNVNRANMGRGELWNNYEICCLLYTSDAA